MPALLRWLTCCLSAALLGVACEANPAGYTLGQKKIDITVQNESSRDVVVDFGHGDSRILEKGDWEFSRGFGVGSVTVCLYEVNSEGITIQTGKKIRCRTFGDEENTWTFR